VELSTKPLLNIYGGIEINKHLLLFQNTWQNNRKTQSYNSPFRTIPIGFRQRFQKQYRESQTTYLKNNRILTIIVETAVQGESFETRIHFSTLRCKTLHKVFEVIQKISENKFNALTSGLRNPI